ncbi:MULTISPECIES: PfkB family carbohydrate kinase [unclassified Rhizobium]|uniref:PfkB family carbohydrate kinase n=1 Tax=unclassified Rhizobium TaxID=2613769 RepID=UPI001619C60F|nr:MULTISPECIES: PfkB family carbohydrate kinase [unclassified Rhizobium]MBB3286893.1 ribokinase [Rhizobium sp. BK252]MBB3401633.1 ribokinase [Rhizobium sp. BK289]MBB3414423.1 ribokinase [Rhizobium sp. BK284]MBB3482311.1 ribokinase [Rhizobium sp. BK347]
MRAYVIGNVAIDETISVLSMPEAGASILGREETRDLGGKGANQAVVMGRTGLSTTLVAAVGKDFRAQTIRDQLAVEVVDAHLVGHPDRSSDFSIIFTTPDGENAIVTTTASAEALTLAEALAPLADATAGDLVVLQGNLSESVTRGILADARHRGLTTAFNPSPLRPYFAELWPLIDVAFLNKGEAESLTGSSGESAIQHLAEAGVAQTVLTLGGAGAILASGSQVIATVPALATEVVDTTGAGDTFMAVALASAALRRTRLDARAIHHATAAAAITVSRRGTRAAFPSKADLAGILAGE